MFGRKARTGTTPIRFPVTKTRTKRVSLPRRPYWGCQVRNRGCVAWMALAALVMFLPARARAQQDDEVLRPLATRAELDSLAGKLPPEGARMARLRLAEGDFQAGDRILLHVDRQPALSDTFDVNQARELMLPIAGPVPLKGVLLGEIETYLTERLRQYLKYPQVFARALIQISVQGAVARPGFYFVPPDGNLSDAIRAAGGTTRDARM